MSSNRTTKQLRLFFTVMMCAFLLVLIVSLKAPLTSQSDGLSHGEGSNPWSSGQKLQPTTIIVIAPILFVFLLLNSPLRREPHWGELDETEGVLRLQHLRNLRLFLRPPPAL